jgi:mannose-1-phosphate guanylyltransferase
MAYNFSHSSEVQNRCAVILAGGDGVRLRSFVQRLRGDCLPKQYVKLLGDRSMLEATLHRAHKLVPAVRQYVVVTEDHLNYAEVHQQLANHPGIHIDAQPCNRDTGMGLLLSLAQLHDRHPESVVVVFPSDHFIREEDLFLAHVNAACRLVEQDGSKIVLLGVTPTAPDVEYGYILANNHWHIAFPFGARAAVGFVEKPHSGLARRLMLQGGFWNTMVMVFKLETLLEQIRALSPMTFRSFKQVCRAVGSRNWTHVVNQVFAQAQPMNLSKGLLEAVAAKRDGTLLVLPVRGVHWSDWGSEDRIFDTLAHAKDCKVGFELCGARLNSQRMPKVAGSA